ncbi:MAG: inositol monophosphatase family protein [Eubacteriales bacterium]
MELKDIKQVALKAGEMLSNRDFQVEHKTSLSDKVTSMDIAVEKFLKEQLLKLLPGSGFLGEESDFYEIENEYVWVVDPIDGTANFVRDLAASCISIGLVKDGEGYMGVVYNPYKDEMFSAEKSKGAYSNDERINVSDMSFESSIYFTSLSPYTKESARVCMDIMEEVYAQADDIRRFGSAAIELCLLACGRADLYFELYLQPWDYAAGSLILEEAGGFAGTVGEEIFKYDKPIPVIAANSKANYTKLKAIVDKHLNK